MRCCLEHGGTHGVRRTISGRDVADVRSGACASTTLENQRSPLRKLSLVESAGCPRGG